MPGIIRKPMPHAPDLSGCALDGRYELHELIGEGAFGRVYRGLDRRLARPVAVKVIKPWWAEDPMGAELRARGAAAGPGQRPRDRPDLRRRPRRRGPVLRRRAGRGREPRRSAARGALPPWEACAIAEQLCRALAGRTPRGRAPRRQAGKRPDLDDGRVRSATSGSRGWPRDTSGLGDGRRHAPLHGARAGARAAPDPGHRRVQRRSRAVRDALRRAAVHGEDRRGAGAQPRGR